MVHRLLTRLGRLSVTAVFLTTTALVVAALLVGGWFGVAVLLAIGGVLAALLARLWPALDARGRASRVLLLALLGGLVVLVAAR
ncbi:MAG: hypothetical protein JXA67_09895 [Micromonosporaceae bacterium]|nr:hypothetical protein [Micromonosporaceae bacterium]